MVRFRSGSLRARRSLSKELFRRSKSSMDKESFKSFNKTFFQDNPNDAESLRNLLHATYKDINYDDIIPDLGTMYSGAVDNRIRSMVSRLRYGKSRRKKRVYLSKKVREFYKEVVEDFFSYMNNVALGRGRGVFTGNMKRNVTVLYHNRGVRIRFPAVARFIEFGTPIDGNRYFPPPSKLIAWVREKWGPQPSKLHESSSEWAMKKSEAKRLREVSQKGQEWNAAYRLANYIHRAGTQPFPFIRETMEYLNPRIPQIAKGHKNVPPVINLQIVFLGKAGRPARYETLAETASARPDLHRMFYTVERRVEENEYDNFVTSIDRREKGLEEMRRKYPKFMETYDKNIMYAIKNVTGVDVDKLNVQMSTMLTDLTSTLAKFELKAAAKKRKRKRKKKNKEAVKEMAQDTTADQDIASREEQDRFKSEGVDEISAERSDEWVAEDTYEMADEDDSEGDEAFY